MRETRKTVNAAESSKLPQYVAALTACLGALAKGTVTGWTGNISEDLKNLSYNGIEIDDDILSWIGSMAALGSLFACIPGAVLCNWLGRKTSILLFTLPCVTGWSIMIFAKWLWMIYFGRFLTGFSAGAFAVIAPIYINEVSEKNTRGTLASCFDLNISLGILLAYILAMFLNMNLYTIIMGIVPLLFGFAFLFQPESPAFYAIKGDSFKVKESLIRLRGKHFDIEAEYENITASVIRNKQNKESFFTLIKKRGTKKAIVICFLLRFLQQAVGIQPIMFYTASIFNSAGVKLDPKVSSIIVGTLQLIANCLSSFIVERLGRRFLLLTSNIGSAVAIAALALFFTLQNRNIIDEEAISKIGFLPVVSLSVFTIFYSIGMGPMPYVVPAEILDPEIKSVVLGGAAIFHFLVSFILTKFYFDIEFIIGTDSTFYMFSGISIFTAIFVYCLIPETKGKTLQEIQKELSA